MDAARVVNWIEIVLWGGVGLIFIWRGITRRGRIRYECAFLGVTFLAFGLSDYVELSTGSWWSPWWLLAWKAACIAIFATAYFIHRKRCSP